MMSHSPNSLSTPLQALSGRAIIAFTAILLTLLSVQKASHAQRTILYNTPDNFEVHIHGGRLPNPGFGVLEFSGYWNGSFQGYFTSAEEDPFPPYWDFLRIQGQIWYSATPGGSRVSPLFDVGFDYPYGLFGTPAHQARVNAFGRFVVDQTLLLKTYYLGTGGHPGDRIDTVDWTIRGSFTTDLGVAGAPEPGTLALLGVGIGVAGVAARRRKR